MAKFKGAELVCCICGAKFKVPPSRAAKATTCSHTCSVRYRAQGLTREKVSLVCVVCGVTYLAHKSQSVGRSCCSMACKNKRNGVLVRESGRLVGEGNHLWKGGTTRKADGYIYENCYGHPFATPNGYVLQHRLVAERHLVETNPESKCLIRLGDNLYLDPALVVHHKNQDRTDNRIENLQVMTNGDHARLHNQLRKSGG